MNAGAILIYDNRFEHATDLPVPRTTCRLRLFEAGERFAGSRQETDNRAR